MIPVGYMAKRVVRRPDSLKADQVEDIYSISDCMSENFADYIHFWRHNGYWFFDSPGVLVETAREHSVDLGGTVLFYYEAHEMELGEDGWHPFASEPSVPTNVVAPPAGRLEGFDVATFHAGTAPECSPLSCNGLSADVPTNAHCLFDTLEAAFKHLGDGTFKDGEPGPFRVFAVYSVPWAPDLGEGGTSPRTAV